MKELNALSKEKQDKHRAQYGVFNDFPPGWREITESEFAKSHYFTYSPILREFRQMFTTERDVPCVGAQLYFMHDGTGYSIVNDYWKGKVRFFQFGCFHEWGGSTEELKTRGIRLMHSEHASFCKKCGYLSIVDSSD
jgi:hypothetical protein